MTPAIPNVEDKERRLAALDSVVVVAELVTVGAVEEPDAWVVVAAVPEVVVAGLPELGTGVAAGAVAAESVVLPPS